MRLNRLKITNFRQFSELDIGFNSQLTVLVGNNSSGKSMVYPLQLDSNICYG